ncbi:tyrosine-type recombinase/integrase [bacterium]
MKPLPVPISAPRYFTELQFQKIIEAIDFIPLKEIVIFAANTGVRISELINLEWTDVNFHKMTIRIANKEDFHTKSKRERNLPLNEAAYDVLSGLPRKSNYIFCRLDGKKRDKHFICRSFKATLREIGLGDGFSFHSLRHTFASQLVQKGVSLYMVQKLMGHANITTTEIYAYLAPETFHKIVGVLQLDDKKDPQIEKMIPAIKTDV